MTHNNTTQAQTQDARQDIIESKELQVMDFSGLSYDVISILTGTSRAYVMQRLIQLDECDPGDYWIN